MCQPSLAAAIGLNEAIFLQQLHYWVERSENQIDGHRWVYNTIADWGKQFPFWSTKTISRTIGSLEKRGLVLSGNYNPKGYDRTKWYTIDYTALETMEREPTSHAQAVEELAEAVDPAIETNCPNEERPAAANALLGVPSGQDDRGMRTNCLVPFGQSGELDGDNLSQPIPDNNSRDYTETTATTETMNERAARFAIPVRTMERFILDYGQEAVQRQLALLEYTSKKNRINNPAGWLRIALREEYTDDARRLDEMRTQRRQARKAKLADWQHEQTEAIKDAAAPHAIDENSPFRGFLERIKKNQEQQKQSENADTR